MAALAVRTVLNTGPASTGRRAELPTELVIRASTAPPRR
jgi:hypothetical protein